MNERQAEINFYGASALFQIEKINGTEYFRFYCPQCHKQVDRDDKFCSQCGIKITYEKKRP